MKIYFVSVHCTAASPAELTLPCGLNIQEGDVCIRSFENTLHALYVINARIEWEKLPLISSSLNTMSICWGNSLLYSFNGIDRRCGNTERLELLSQCFSDKIFNKFLSEVIAILKYEKDLIDLAVLKTLIEPGRRVLNRPLRHSPSAAATKNSIEKVSFFSCLSSELQNEVAQKLDRDNPHCVLRHIRTAYPKEFRIAFKEFNEKNPEGNIYFGLPYKKPEASAKSSANP